MNAPEREKIVGIGKMLRQIGDNIEKKYKKRKSSENENRKRSSSNCETEEISNDVTRTDRSTE